MKINVTQRHIDEGKSGDGSHCAIALAIREQVGMPVMVGAMMRWAAKRCVLRGNPFSSLLDIAIGTAPQYDDNTAVGIVKLGDSTGYRDIGVEAATFIEAFDKDKTTAKPFSFELDYELEAVESPIKIYPSPVKVEAREEVQIKKQITLPSEITKNYG